MRLEEATKPVIWPVGGTECAANYRYMFPFVFMNGVKELELTPKEMRCFIEAYIEEFKDLTCIKEKLLSFKGLTIKLIE